MLYVQRTVPATFRIVDITVTSSATTVRSLVDTALGVLGNGNTMAEMRTTHRVSPVEVHLEPAADILAQSATWADDTTLTAGVREVFVASDVLDELKLTRSASPDVTTKCIIYFI